MERARYPVLIDPLSASSSDSVSGDSNSEFGAEVVSFKDYGYAIGAPGYDGGQTNEGAVFVFETDPDDTDVNIDTPEVWSDESDQAGTLFGTSITAGFFKYNNSGGLDLAIGASYWDSGSNQYAGKVYVYHFDPNTDSYPSSPDWTKVQVSQSYTSFGWSLTTGNFDHDSYDDLAVGAPDYDVTGGWDYDSGGVWVYEVGSSGLSSTAAWSEVGSQKYRLGYSLSAANLNGDSYVDLAIGAPGYGYDSYYSLDRKRGAFYVYEGSSTSLGSSYADVRTCGQDGAQFGFSLEGRRSTSTDGSQTSMWDVDDDGYDDIIVGAPYYDNGQTDEGVAFVYYGSSTGISSTADWQAESDQTSAYLGYDVTGLPDISGNGYPDIAIGAPGFDSTNTDQGKTYVWTGSSSGVNGGTDGAGSNAAYDPVDLSGSYTYAGKSLDAIDNNNHSGFIVGSPGGDHAVLLGF